MEKMYYDTEQDEYISESDLFLEYCELKSNGDTEAESFFIYIRNCTDKNGTLELVH